MVMIRSTESQFGRASSGPTSPPRPVTGSRLTRQTAARLGRPIGYRTFEGRLRSGRPRGGWRTEAPISDLGAVSPIGPYQRASRKLAGLVTTSRLVGSDRCCFRLTGVSQVIHMPDYRANPKLTKHPDAIHLSPFPQKLY